MNKHRIKNSNGIEIVLFEKGIVSTPEYEQRINEISQDIDLSSIENDIAELRSRPIYEPESIDTKFDQVATTFTNLLKRGEIKDFRTRSIQIPFAVRVNPAASWGGRATAGIFWGDPTHKPLNSAYDTWSVKVGHDDDELIETGYTYGDVSALAMRFSTGWGSNRGWVWSTVGPASVEGGVMSLTQRGKLALRDSLELNRKLYHKSSPNEHQDYKDENQIFGHIHISEYKSWDDINDRQYVGQDTGEVLPFITIGIYDSHLVGKVPVYRRGVDIDGVDNDTGRIIFEDVAGATGGTSVHNDLTAIQGGDTDEYYHFSSDQHADLLALIYDMPTFASFKIDNHNSGWELEIGDDLTADGNVDFSWTFTNSVNVVSNTLDVIDSIDGNIITNISTTSPHNYNYVTSPSHNTPTIRTYTIIADATNGSNFVRQLNVYWRHRSYWGSSALTVLTESDIIALQNSSLVNDATRTYDCDVNNYKWICIPAAFPQPTDFTYNGNSVAMETPIDVTVDNSADNPVLAIPYKCYRTTNQSVAAWEIIGV